MTRFPGRYCGRCCGSIVWGGPYSGPSNPIQSLYTQSESCVRVLGSKSDSFPVGVGLRQGCALSPILFVIFMDRISRCSHGGEVLQFGGLRIASLLFADDVVLMAPSASDLQHSLDRFAAECEAPGMRISTSKLEAMVLSRKLIDCLLWVGNEFLPQVKEFKYLGILFSSEGTREREMGRRIGARERFCIRFAAPWWWRESWARRQSSQSTGQ